MKERKIEARKFPGERGRGRVDYTRARKYLIWRNE